MTEGRQVQRLLRVTPPLGTRGPALREARARERESARERERERAKARERERERERESQRERERGRSEMGVELRGKYRGPDKIRGSSLRIEEDRVKQHVTSPEHRVLRFFFVSKYRGTPAQGHSHR